MQPNDVFSPDELSWILPNLAMGRALPARLYEPLARGLGVRYVIDLRQEAKDDELAMRPHGLTLLHLPTQDGQAVSVQSLDRGVRWARLRLDSGSRVFVHCSEGVGRSALLVCCILVSLGHTPLGALRWAKEKRPMVAPSRAQLAALFDWTVRWCQEQRQAAPSGSSDDLVRVIHGRPRS